MSGTTTPAKSRGIIHVSTVVWYRGAVPSELTLADVGIKIRQNGYFTALAARGGQSQGWIDAREHGEATGKRYTIIDVTLDFGRNYNEAVLSADEAHRSPILQANRLSDQELSRIYAACGYDAGAQPSRASSDLMKIMEHPRFKETKMLLHDARTTYGSADLTMASIPHRHWDLIKEARSLIDPGMVIRLTPPTDATTDQVDLDSTPTDTPRTGGPAPD